MKEPSLAERVAADEPTAERVARVIAPAPVVSHRKLMLMIDVVDAAVQLRHGKGKRGRATRKETLEHERALREAVDALEGDE